ncbi:MAG: sugar transferase [Lachnospiraceae bacterium]
MYKKEINSWWKHWDFIILDQIFIQIAFVLSYILRQGFGLPYLASIYRPMTFYLIFLHIIISLFNSSYTGILRRGYYREFYKVVVDVSFVVALASVLLVLTKGAGVYSRLVLVFTWVFSIILCHAARVIRKHQLRTRTEVSPANVRYLLVISEMERMEDSLRYFKQGGKEEIVLCGACVADQNIAAEEIEGIPVVCKFYEILDYICKNQVDEVFLNMPANPEAADKIIKGCAAMGVVAHFKIGRFSEAWREEQTIQTVGGYTVVSRFVKIATPRELFVKRMMDIAGGCVGLVLTGILFIFVAPAIYIKSPGPIFFSQQRVGKNGRIFTIHKFRSMHLDAEERKKELMSQNRVKDGLMFKMENDPRIIGSENGRGIGNFIRKTSIDEFPQFWNVLKGEMSLVGTRPPTLDEWEKYEFHHRKRMAVKPGLAGMWQVNGRSEITDFEEVVRMDTEYIASWSIGEDIKILLRTIFVIFGKNNAM